VREWLTDGESGNCELSRRGRYSQESPFDSVRDESVFVVGAFNRRKERTIVDYLAGVVNLQALIELNCLQSEPTSSGSNPQ
jgi:hypothetical protein